MPIPCRSPSRLLLIVRFVVFACTAIAGVPAQADIVVGLAVPAAGRDRETGNALRSAAERAIGELNAKGGVLGEALRLAVEDDACSEAGAVAAANALIAKRVKLVIGHPCSKAALSAAQVYGPAGVLFIATATRHPALTDKRAGKTIFRLSGRDDRQASDAADWLLSQTGSGPIAVIHDKTAYSRGLAAGIAAALIDKGQPAPLDYPITAGENVYAPVIAKLKAAGPRAVFFAGYPAEANIVVTALRAAGLNPPVLGSDSLATAEFTRESAAADPAVRVLSRFGTPTPAQPASPATTSDTPATGKSWPPSLAAEAKQTADAIFTWADACQRTSTNSAEKIAESLAATSAGQGAGGISFNEKGDAQIRSFVTVQWSGKDWVNQN